MAETKKKKGLGRGLSSLLTDISETPDVDIGSVASAPIDLIRPNPKQPRRIFPPSEMDELAASIAEKGILQPLLVRPDPDNAGGYQIIAGERRWRAAQVAQLHEAPIIVKEFSDVEMLEVSIIENVQRADLNPLDEAIGYGRLVDEFGHSQAEIARSMGKSRPYIANALRLLNLPDDVKALLEQRTISAGHARALVSAEDPSALARQIVAKGLSVRETEALAKRVSAPRRSFPKPPKKDADTRVLEDDLSAALGLKVQISDKGGAGDLRIAYKSLDELDGLCQLLMK